MSSVPLQAVQAAAHDSFLPQMSSAAAHEAARYAVLRRIGSAIRHQIAGALQPVSMMASMLERRLQAQPPNLDALRRNSGEMSALSRAAGAECVALMSWLAPPPGEQVPLARGIEDCLHLLTTELSFRGFTVTDATQGETALVCRNAVRMLAVAGLLALTDSATSAAHVRVSVAREAGFVLLSMAMAPSGGDGELPPPAKGYRALSWRDVQALAEAEDVAVELGVASVQLRLPVLAPPEPDGADARWG